jgi:Na+-transporting NADH:ubiquinone oxidoreductase subunit NqrD
VDLTIYHALVSITVPILLVELAFPERRGEPWLKGRWLFTIAILFILDVLFGLFLFNRVTAYSPNPLHILFALIIASAFFIAAKRLRRGWAIKADKQVKRPHYYLLYTFIGSIVCIVVFYVLPNLIPTQGGPLLTIILGIALILTLITGLRFDWKNSSDHHRLAICAGSLLVLILITPIQELDKSRTDNPRGMIAVGLSAVVFLLLLYWKIRRREKNKTNIIPDEVQSTDQ